MNRRKEHNAAVIANHEMVPVTEARGNLRELVDRVAYERARIVLSKNGLPHVAVVGIQDLERLVDIDRLEGHHMMAEADAVRNPADAGVSIDEAVNPNTVRPLRSSPASAGARLGNPTEWLEALSSAGGSGVQRFSVEEFWASALGHHAIHELQHVLLEEVLDVVVEVNPVADRVSAQTKVQSALARAFKSPMRV